MEDETMSTTSPFPQIIQQWQDLANKGDAAGLAALYSTNDPVAIFTEGIFRGQSAIQANLSTQFQQGWKNIKLTDDEDHPQGNWAWSVGEWSSTFAGQAVSGYWSVLWVQQGSAWKIQQQTVVTQIPQLKR
jgi:ketosteroid isomerase-like protein